MQSQLIEGELREGSIKLSMNVDELRVYNVFYCACMIMYKAVFTVTWLI